MRKNYQLSTPIDAMTTRQLRAEILKAVLLGALVASMFVAPNMGQVYRLFSADKKSSRLRIRRNIKYLRQNGFLSIQPKSGKVLLHNNGTTLINEHELYQLNYTPTRRWNKKWFVVLFDIPVNMEYQRRLFRLKLLEIGFVCYQQSVYVYPYTCTDLLKKMVQILGIQDHVRCMVVTLLEQEIQLRRHFKL